MKRYLCPECGDEMAFLGSDGFLSHLTSTDCAPAPWPDLLSVVTVVDGEWIDDATWDRLPPGVRNRLDPGSDESKPC